MVSTIALQSRVFSSSSSSSSSFSSSSSSLSLSSSSVCKITVKTSTKTPAILSRFLSSRNGSGVLLSSEKCTKDMDENFFVLTAAHVASMAGARRDGLECLFPSENMYAVSVQAEVFSVHERLDLALLRVKTSTSSESSLSSLSSRGLELSQTHHEKKKFRVRAFGYPMAYANPLSLFHASKGIPNESNGEIIGYSGDFSHIAHTAKVASGCSGGPLLCDDYVLGIHSFGDKFYGGEADVAVCCSENDLIDMLNNPVESPSDWDTNTINEKLMKSSLKAMRDIFPDIPEKEAKRWIL